MRNPHTQILTLTALCAKGQGKYILMVVKSRNIPCLTFFTYHKGSIKLSIKSWVWGFLNQNLTVIAKIFADKNIITANIFIRKYFQLNGKSKIKTWKSKIKR
jgi:hypothetical protein